MTLKIWLFASWEGAEHLLLFIFEVWVRSRIISWGNISQPQNNTEFQEVTNNIFTPLQLQAANQAASPLTFTNLTQEELPLGKTFRIKFSLTVSRKLSIASTTQLSSTGSHIFLGCFCGSSGRYCCCSASCGTSVQTSVTASSQLLLQLELQGDRFHLSLLFLNLRSTSIISPRL